MEIKRRCYRNLFCIVAGIVLFLWIATKTQASPLLGVTVRVGYAQNTQMIQSDGKDFWGYSIDYLNKIAYYTGWNYDFIMVDEDEQKDALLDGKIDLICDATKFEAVEGMQLSNTRTGITFCMLCAKEDNDTVFFNDYHALNGKRIAIVESKGLEPLLQEFAGDHQIYYIPVYCKDFASMEEAVNTGKADLILALNQRRLDGYKYIAKVGVMDQYFAVKSERTDLTRLINYANRQISIQDPFFVANLYNQYYGDPAECLNGETKEEYEFIKRGEKVRVACVPARYPLEYLNDKGEYAGIYADALKLIGQKSGLQFEYVACGSCQEAMEKVKAGEADMTTGVYADANLMKEYGTKSTRTWLDEDYTVVGRAGENLPDVPVIAIPKQNQGLLFFLKENYPNWQIEEQENIKDCLKAVASKQADGCVLHSVFLQTLFDLNQYNGLAVLPMQEMQLSVSSVVGKTAKDAILRSIMDKAISAIPKENFARCTVENAIMVPYEMEVEEIIRKGLPWLIGCIIALVVVFIVYLRVRERHFHHLAITDEVTGLWNGVKFRHEAEGVLQREKKKVYQMVSLDIEHFKFVNNDFGSKAADGILQVVAKRICQQFGRDAIYGRDIADVFLIMVEKREDLEDLLLPISQEIRFENNGREQHYKPVVKFGVCEINPREMDTKVNEYVDRTGIARKSIKQNSLYSVAYYNQVMAEEISQERKIERKMEGALRDHEFVVYFQPKFHLRDETIIGAEALVRWRDPHEGLVAPGQFIPIFEKNGFIVRLDFYVYEEVMRSMSRWLQEGRKPIVVSMNVSRAHIGTEDFLPNLIQLANRYQVPHNLIELELTETIFGGKWEDISEFILKSKEAGFLISIDDYGSGYSSLNLLKEIPVDVLKIDREFLNETEVSKKSSIIIEQIVEMASKIEISTICEGVETKNQAEFLKKIGCDMAQGYLFSRPIPVEEFEKMLEA